MKIKTENLIGPALNWAVAKCEGGLYQAPSVRDSVWMWPGEPVKYSKCAPDYSTDWAQGGPLLDKYGIGVYREAESSCNDDGWTYAEGETWEAIIGIYYVGEHEGRCQGLRVKGPTPLIAAMRALVESTLGDEIEIPEDLL